LGHPPSAPGGFAKGKGSACAAVAVASSKLRAMAVRKTVTYGVLQESWFFGSRPLGSYAVTRWGRVGPHVKHKIAYVFTGSVCKGRHQDARRSLAQAIRDPPRYWLWHEVTSAPFPLGTFPRIRAVLRKREPMPGFIRLAVERELRRREKQRARRERKDP
jgi:hypothetical protein